MYNKKKREIQYYDYKKGCAAVMDIPICSKSEFLEEKNKKYMNNIALSFEGRKITYEELHERKDEYAKALYKKGIRQGDRIAVCGLNTPETIFLMYALDKIGAVKIGLNPFNNEWQMRQDIEMIRPKFVIIVEALYGRAKNILDALNISEIIYSPMEHKANKKNNVYLEDILSESEAEGIDINFEIKDDEYVSDIVFTGGSTGVHKGVEIYADSLNVVVSGLEKIFFLEPGEIHLGNIPVNHMVFGIALTHYVLCSNLEYALSLKVTPEFFVEEIIRTRANGIMGGPIHFENLIDNPRINKGSLSSVIQAASGGEHFKMMKKRAAEEALRKGGSNAIIGNIIGSTETSSATHGSIIDTRKNNGLLSVSTENDVVTCGYPIPGVEYKIVNPDTYEEVKKGEEGVMLIGGPTIMKGYYQNPKENEKVFVYDKDGKRWLNQGDIMRNIGENYEEVAFSGRKKRNFVCNITNIYPEEIESLLLEFEEIDEVAVTKIPDAKYQYLPSYHIRIKDAECDLDMLHEKIERFILERLGSDALPGYISFTSLPLPRTANAKLDVLLLEKEDLENVKQNKLEKITKKY